MNPAASGPPPPSTQPLDLEAAKRTAAVLAVREHFPAGSAFRYIGIGSGTTIVYVVEAIIAQHPPSVTDAIRFVPTGYQSRQTILKAGLKDLKFDSLPDDAWIDVAFDGADEVDEDMNCIKGGGACLYQEKLVAMRAKKFVCVADYRKLQPRLLTKWPSIPIEVEPLAAQTVLRTLKSLGSPTPALRAGHIEKAGPLKTDQDNFIIDAPFPQPLLISSETGAAPAAEAVSGGALEGSGGRVGSGVEELAREIKGIEGVLSVGIFSGLNGLQATKMGGGRGGQKPVACYFGMADGTVKRRVADEEGRVVES